jgi:SAM domain (Sterile alpha motif)
VALRHDELKEMGIVSVGHRLTILKSVYDVKVNQDIPIDADHYIPLCKPLCCPQQDSTLIALKQRNRAYRMKWRRKKIYRGWQSLS